MSTVVTGGASGIGFAVVQLLLESDGAARCVVLDVQAEGASELQARFGPERLLLRTCDVSQPAAVQEAMAAAVEWGGAVGGLVTCAASGLVKPALEIDYAEWRRVLSVHLDGAVLCCQEAGRRMARQGGGSIVNFGSIGMFYGWPERLPYAAAKAAIGAVTRTLAVEWAPYGIRVNAVAPGYVETPYVRGLADRGQLDEERIGRLHALGRFARPAEIASVVRFLLSEEASFVTGEVVRVDGGFPVFRLNESKQAQEA